MFRQNRFAESDKLLCETLKSQSHVLGAESPDTLASKALLARILIAEGNPRGAEELARQAFETQLRILGPQHADTLNTLQYLGIALVSSHQYDQAKKLFATDIEAIGKMQGGDPSNAWYNFACVAAAAKRADDAVEYLRQSIATGFSDADHLQSDDDLKLLRGDPRFASLVNEARARALARQKAE